MSARRLALVTGAAGGIGLEVATRLDARGYTVIAVERDLALAEKACVALGAGSVPVACDLSDLEAVAALGRRIETEWADELELLICNAGVIVPGDVVDTAAAQLDLQLNVMLVGVLHLITSGTRVFVAKDRGHVLATVSMGGIISMPGSAAYSAAKFGLRAYLGALHCELKDTGVRVSGIYPSAVDTPMLEHEATHGGSLLNFVGAVSSAADVADGYDKALESGKLEVYVPYSDSITSRVFGTWPWLLPPLLGRLNRMGAKGHRKYLTAHGLD